jgi:transmembrane sensor
MVLDYNCKCVVSCSLIFFFLIRLHLRGYIKTLDIKRYSYQPKSQSDLKRIDDLIERYFENRVSEEERCEIFRLIATGQIEDIVKEKIQQTLSNRLRVGELPDAEMSAKGEKIFQAILEKNGSSDSISLKINIHSDALNKPYRGHRRILSYAAVFIILLLAGLFAYPRKTPGSNKIAKGSSAKGEMIKIINLQSSPQMVTLEDGSTVMLEPGSEIEYNEQFATCREVYLSGDAFFDVVKDPSYPFYVHANEITTKVLGTSFRVKANESEMEIVVAVKTGRVTVFAKSTTDDAQTRNLQQITLTPNQQAIYKRAEQVVVKKIVEKPRVINTQAVLKDSYVNESVVFILEALSKSYGVEIRFNREALLTCTLTSDIIEGEGLYEQLDIVCNALGGTYRMEEDASIAIEANGCQSMNDRP